MAKRTRKQKQAARDRFAIEVDERTAEELGLESAQRRLPVEEHLLYQVRGNYDAIRSQRLSFDDLIRLRGGTMR